MRSATADPLAPVPSAARVAAAVAIVFVVAGTAWVLLTDVALYELVHDPVLVARVETAKGWTFVGLAAALVYAVTFVAVARVSRARRVLATVVESIGDGLLLLGRDRTIVHANPVALGLLRCADPRELDGMGAERFSRRYRVSYLDGSVVRPEDFVSQRAFVEAGPVRYKCVLHPREGAEVVLSCTGAAVREHVDEAPELVVSVMHDITESEHRTRLYDGFFAAVAHSLKTPIAVASAHARILSDAPSETSRRSATAIERQCGRIDALVQNLLVLARARSGTLRLHPRPGRLSSVLERLATDRAVVALERRVDLQVEEDAVVHVDEERLVTALRNVVDDLARGSPGSPITLRLRRDGEDAELGVIVRRPAQEEPPGELALDHDDRALGREVTERIVAAHGGTRRTERTSSEDGVWIRLPVSEG
jgi:signal transduction histidine kinase